MNNIFYIGFRKDFLKALDGLGPSSTRGYYINSCFSHCQSQQQAYWFGLNSPRLFNKVVLIGVVDDLSISSLQFRILKSSFCFVTDYSWSSKRLVFGDRSISTYWLPLSLWQNMCCRHWYNYFTIQVILGLVMLE